MTKIKSKEKGRQIALKDLHEKSVLTKEEVIKYFGFSTSQLYKLSSGKRIPHYRLPGGRKLFFKRKEVEEWILSNRVLTVSDAESISDEFLLNNSKKSKLC